MYGYDYNSYANYAVMNSMASAAAVFMVLLLIGFIASIVLTVVLYKKYGSDNRQPSFRLGDKSTWGPFFKFDTLIIDSILKVLFIFCALDVAFFFIAVILASVALGFGAFILTLIFGAIGLLISELVIRVSFEESMLSVIITHNTIALKNHFCGDGTPGDAPAAQLPPSDAPVDPVAPVEAAPEVEVAPEASSESKTCPECGTENDSNSNFCYKCGKQF